MYHVSPIRQHQNQQHYQKYTPQRLLSTPQPKFTNEPYRQQIQPKLPTFQGRFTTYQLVSNNDLGSGTYCSVKLVKDLSTNNHYAMKIISKAKMEEYGAEENIRQEILLHSKLTHKHVIKFYEVFEDYSNIYITLEYCSQGNLQQLLNRRRKFSEKETFDFVIQICLGIEYMHNQGLVHRDLKPENILLNAENQIKICDFNWATSLGQSKMANPVICGTTEYMPPEVVTRRYHDQKVDIWSLGIIIYELLHGDIPYKGYNQEEKIANILCNKNFQIDYTLPLDLQILIVQLLSRIVDQRPTIQQVLSSKWFMRQNKETMVQPTMKPLMTKSAVNSGVMRQNYFDHNQNTPQSHDKMTSSMGIITYSPPHRDYMIYRK